MSLLEHPLIQKYFGKVENIAFPGKLYSPGKDCDMDWMVRCVVADRVLAAMSEPLKKTDKYLYVDDRGGVREGEGSENSVGLVGFHPQYLRIPSAHQPQRPPSVNGMRCGHHGYEKKCLECSEVEIRTPWMDMPKAPPPSVCEHPFASLVFQAKGILCCLCTELIKRSCYHENHRNKLPCPDCGEKPSPTPQHTRENCQHIGGWCTLCKPEPRGEFGDDLNEAVFKTVNAIWNGPAKTHNEIEVLVRALLRFSRAGKPEAK